MTLEEELERSARQQAREMAVIAVVAFALGAAASLLIQGLIA